MVYSCTGGMNTRQRLSSSRGEKPLHLVIVYSILAALCQTSPLLVSKLDNNAMLHATTHDGSRKMAPQE